MKKLLLALMFAPTLLFGAQEFTPPITFGGVDYLNIDSEIDDKRAKDSQNFVSDQKGSAEPRRGTQRYISQAISTNPASSLYHATVDRGTYTKTALFMTTWDKIYVSSDDVNPVWEELKSGLNTPNQKFTFVNNDGVIVMTGDALTDDIFQYNMISSSFSGLFDSVASSTDYPKLRAKHIIARDGYLLLGNIMDVSDGLTGGATHYGSRVQYSLFQNISSFTWSRYIDIKTDDGESITGMTDKGIDDGSLINVYKPNSITNITYSVLNLTIAGGDIAVDTVVVGFGCISPHALVNIGFYDIVPTKSGFVFYDGGRKNRVDVVQELKPISTLLGTLYERTIEEETYDESVCVYYPKKQRVLWSFNDPNYLPADKNNRTFVYNIGTGEWHPLKGWLVESFTTRESDGQLFYGDAMDAYVYEADLKIKNDDARLEISVDAMESTSTWTISAVADTTEKVEGEASIKMTNSVDSVWIASMTRVDLINFGEWNDGTLVDRSRDKLSFKLKVTSLAHITDLRVDLLYEPTISEWGTEYSSVSLSSANLSAQGVAEGGFMEVEIALSSFTLLDDWTNPAVQTIPFLNPLSVYGIRFVGNSISTCSFYIDDLRVVQKTVNPIEVYYICKQFSLQSVKTKDWRQIVLTREKASDSSFSIDVFTDFGYYANTIESEASIPKEVFVCGYKGEAGITRLDSTDLSVIDSTASGTANIFDYMNAVANEDYVIPFDKEGSRVLLLDRDDMSVILSSFGSLGSGTLNFNTVNQMCLVKRENVPTLYLVDTFNDRIVELVIENDEFKFVQNYGSWGLGVPTSSLLAGITADQTHLWIADDGNQRISKYTSDFELVSDERFDSNAIGECVLQNDGEFLYSAYNKVANEPYFQDVVLEKRNKSDMSILQRVVVKPQDVVVNSTYTLSGDIAILGKYIFIGFTKDLATTGTYYIQKRLKDGFTIVDEYSTDNTQFSVFADGYPYLPNVQAEKINLESPNGTYIQFKFYSNEIDNTFKLFNYSFAIDTIEYEEQPK